LQVLRSQHSCTFDQSAIIRNDSAQLFDKRSGISCAPSWRMIAKHFKELRAWQTAQAFKLSLYKLIEVGPLSGDERLRTQLREAAASATSHISEGFGRFDPVDFARFVKMARASIMECQNHLQDAVDRRYITESVRADHVAQSNEVLKEVGGLLDYLQSPEAKRNAERIKQRRFERRNRRSNLEPRTENPEQEP
jgi:four helix bundle protein